MIKKKPSCFRTDLRPPLIACAVIGAVLLFLLAVLSFLSEGSSPVIPPEHLPHLFERFYRADSSRGEQSGFGLGLSIADTIAREHKGSLRAESDAVSTRFIFTLPSVDKGKHGFSELKQRPASFSSLPGGSPAASSASLSRRFRSRKTPKDFPASKNGR